MSKDIRSFFTVKSSSPNLKTTSQKQEHFKKGSKKRPVVVIDSDSDEDTNSLFVKRSKASVEAEKNSIPKKKASPPKISSKYFEKSSVNINEVFGTKPVKRDNSRNIVKKTVAKESVEFHIDKDLESELLKLDIINEELLSNNACNNKISELDNSKTFEGDTLKSTSASNKVENYNTEEIKTKKKNREKVEDNVTCNKPLEKKAKSENDHYELPRKKIKAEIKQISPEKDKSLKRTRSDSKLKTPPKPSPIKDTLFKESPFKNSETKPSPSKISPVKKLSSIATETSKGVKNDRHIKIDTQLNSSESKKTFALKLTEEKDLKSIKPSSKYNQSTSKCMKVSPSKKETDTESKVAIDSPCNLWVDKYKPTSTKQIIGQQGDKSCVNKLITWLNNWDRNQSGNKKLVKPSPWAKNDDGAFFKAALLSGPPGVGKTTTAHLVARELGLDVVEFNASDTRSKKLLHQEVSELLSTSSLSPFFTGKSEHVSKQHVLLMDEVDGMAGNEDRGGMQELILLIKQSRIPIICMCNDRNHPKIRSLANYCFDLRFSKPRVEQIKGAMMSMCFKEKLKLTPDVLTDIITSANQDIRLIINHLSMLAMNSSKLANSTKHIKMGPWDITRKIFSEEEHKTMSIYDKSDLFFHDYSVTPLFVQENYINAVPHKPEAKNKIKKMEMFATAAKSLSLGDLTEKSIRSHNAWNLLPVQAVFSSLVPGEVLEGHIGAQINFPAWFGKNSRQIKLSRLLQELTVHSRLKISGNKEAMNLDYVTPLESSIVSPLVTEGAYGIPQALSVLSDYCLVREDLESLAELSSWPNTRNRFSDVDSKVKAAFTRAYNKTSVPTPYASVPIKKGNKSDVELSEPILSEEGETAQLQEDEEENEDDPEVDSMIVVKKKQAAKKAVKVGSPSTSKSSKTSKRGRKK